MLAFVLMSSLSFANDTKIMITDDIDGGICHYSITRTLYFPDGSIEQETRHYYSYTVNAQDCRNQANAKLTMLKDGAPF